MFSVAPKGFLAASLLALALLCGCSIRQTITTADDLRGLVTDPTIRAEWYYMGSDERGDWFVSESIVMLPTTDRGRFRYYCIPGSQLPIINETNRQSRTENRAKWKIVFEIRENGVLKRGLGYPPSGDRRLDGSHVAGSTSSR